MQTKTKALSLFLVTVMIGMTNQSHAGIMYDDVANDLSGTPDLGSLMAGDNTIVGSLDFLQNADTEDSFTFSLDNGFRLDNVSIVVTDGSFLGLNGTSQFDGFGPSLDLWTHDLPFQFDRTDSWAEDDFSGTLVMPPIDTAGGYRISHVIGSQQGSYNYTITLSVTATQAVIPEPTSFAIFGAGLLGTFGIGRRRKPRH